MQFCVWYSIIVEKNMFELRLEPLLDISIQDL